MRLILAVALALVLGALGATRASAQPGDPPAICTSSATIWNSVSAGTDVSTMRAVRTQTPAACRVLLSRIDARIAALTAPRAQATPPAGDPCVAARADWASVQNSTSLSELQSYRSMVPASCTLWRTRADERIAALRQQQQQQAAAAAEQQRLANEAANRRAQVVAQSTSLIAAARAAGIEGVWTGSRPEVYCSTSIKYTFQLQTDGMLQTALYNGSVRKFYIIAVAGNVVTLTERPDNPSENMAYTVTSTRIDWRGSWGGIGYYNRCR